MCYLRFHRIQRRFRPENWSGDQVVVTCDWYGNITIRCTLRDHMGILRQVQLLGGGAVRYSMTCRPVYS